MSYYDRTLFEISNSSIWKYFEFHQYLGETHLCVGASERWRVFFCCLQSVSRLFSLLSLKNRCVRSGEIWLPPLAGALK